jgi:phenylpyruvate tautomerase PptA (4-oxalocrotonate tautomerase family)
MPIVRVDIPTGYPNATKDQICAGIKSAIDDVFDPAQRGRYPETRKWIYVSVREAHGALGDGLPTVTVDTRPGRRPETKAELARRICDVFENTLGTRDVYVLLRETAAADHLGGGVPLPDWRPA